MPAYLRWFLALTVALLVTVVPFLRFRWVYTHGKRFREVTPGRFYRSGEMTGAGFTEAVRLHQIRTIVNLQDEYPDPDVFVNYFGGKTIKESALCRELGVRYVYLPPDLIPPALCPAHRPRAIDQFLALLDNPTVYPVLIHCRAGLHRTGIMTALYRMEYDHWSPGQAVEELKDNGFGEWPCSSANEYITQYILTYQPGLRAGEPVARGP